jgi:hypothetical protein
MTKPLEGLCLNQHLLTNTRVATKPKRSVKRETDQVKNRQVSLKYENNDHLYKIPYKMLQKNEKGLIKAKMNNPKP